VVVMTISEKLIESEYVKPSGKYVDRNQSEQVRDTSD